MRRMEDLTRHYALIGMAFVVGDYPLYYDATNEKGLSMAGLNFPHSAVYREPEEGKDNVASFESIPWILGQCATVAEARPLLSRINLTTDAFSEQLPPSSLHWMIADQNEVIVFEQTARGGTIYENPVGVMTNEPPFDYQMTHLQDFMNASASLPENRLVRLAVRQGRLHTDEFYFGRFRIGEYLPVLQNPGLCRTAARLLPPRHGPGRQRSLRIHHLQLLLQHGPWNLLLYDV